MGPGNPFDSFMFSAVPFFIFIVFAIVVMIFITSFVKGIGQYFRNNSIPEKHIPARLVGKRVHTWGGHGNMSAHTSYYATFETEAGDRLEFPVGSQFSGMHVEGDSGMLTHRGTRFIGFERERM
ncbi:MAG: hypothetical protein APF77_21315 [Clostridia bacterium BRH_c25]|nr:MAG: hypothetical protein APF77_21315 [Clostridia bacterium BRH_c25]